MTLLNASGWLIRTRDLPETHSRKGKPTKANEGREGGKGSAKWDESRSRSSFARPSLLSDERESKAAYTNACMLPPRDGKAGKNESERAETSGKGSEDEEERREMVVSRAHHVHDSSDGHVGPVDPLLSRFASHGCHLCRESREGWKRKERKGKGERARERKRADGSWLGRRRRCGERESLGNRTIKAKFWQLIISLGER